jgi:urea transport system substrate-binding protein
MPFFVSVSFIFACGAGSAFAADDTIKVGILHSLSGASARVESQLKDVLLFLIEEQNKKGGVLGKKLEGVVVDPATNAPLFREKAQELIVKDKVAVVFGGWSTASLAAVTPLQRKARRIDRVSAMSTKGVSALNLEIRRAFRRSHK